MLEDNSTVHETYAKSPGAASSRQYSPENLALSAPASEKQGEDALRLQANQLLAGPAGFASPGDASFRRLEIEGTLQVRPADLKLRIDLDKGGINPLYTYESVKLQQAINCLPSESVRKYSIEGMADAEKRMQKGEISKQELADTYKQVNRLLANPSPYLSDAERANVAAGILHHTGEGRIDQGVHATCNVNVLQNIAFDHKPSLAAEMIATATLTGEWKAGDGKVIRVPKDSMKPGWEEEKFPPEDGLRSHASQIFQVVALNDVGQREKDPKEYVQKPMGLESGFYMLGQALLPWSEYWMPNGYEVWRDSKGHETQFGGLSGRQIQEESQRLFGDKYETIAYKSPYEWLSHPWSSDDNDYKLTKLVESENALRQTLSKLDADGKLPAVVAVNGEMSMLKSSTAEYIVYGVRALVRPFKTLHEAVDSRLGVANHVVTVTKFDKAKDRVYVQNSWGKDQDGWVSIKDLWKAV